VGSIEGSLQADNGDETGGELKSRHITACELSEHTSMSRRSGETSGEAGEAGKAQEL
jgi:hypothetical protein